MQPARRLAIALVLLACGMIFLGWAAVVRSASPADRLLPGEARLDAPSGLAYGLEDFDDRSPGFNDFQGNWGELLGEYITATIVSQVYSGTGGASLRLDYNLPDGAYTGLWQSLWGHSESPAALDFTDLYGVLKEAPKDFEQLQFWVRGSGLTNHVHRLKIELKDAGGDYFHTAYRYITVNDNDTAWRLVTLDADVANAAFWSYNQYPPDPTRMKELVIVIERARNPASGRLYLDEFRFIDADDAPFDPAVQGDDAFLELVSRRAFQYFLDWYDPATGLYQDRSTFPDLMSAASTGFGLAALAVGEAYGWIDRPIALERISHTLAQLEAGQTAGNPPQTAAHQANGYRGFYYHFLGPDGLRAGESELSPVDTALLLFGALVVREHFSGEAALVAQVDRLLARVEWDWMLDPADQLFHLAWKPECGGDYQVPAAPGDPSQGCFSNFKWDTYTDEVILINLLAISSPAHPVGREVFYAWERPYGTYGGVGLIHSWNGSFFTYAFAHLFIDFDLLGADNHPDPGLRVDWGENTRQAAQAAWQYAVDHQDDVVCDGDDDYVTYGPQAWGLTAAEGPDQAYHAYGAAPVSPATSPEHDGTLAPYGAGMALPYLPEKALPALRVAYTSTDLWGARFGFGDAYNLDLADCGGAWLQHTLFGIDEGPLLLSIDDYRSELIWKGLGLASRAPLARPLCGLFCDLELKTPRLAASGAAVRLNAEVHPILSEALPFTYTWMAAGFSPVVHTDRGPQDSLLLSWATPGVYTVTVQVSGPAGGLAAQASVRVVPNHLYLPAIPRITLKELAGLRDRREPER
jgi:hypothetical protein